MVGARGEKRFIHLRRVQSAAWFRKVEFLGRKFTYGNPVVSAPDK